MKKLIIKVLLLVWSFVALSVGDLLAQCAMCKASVETNVNVDGIGFAAKLNTGILYLFVTPYLLVIIIGYLWYKKSKEHKQLLEETATRKSRIANLES